jgi:hypothetical protein
MLQLRMLKEVGLIFQITVIKYDSIPVISTLCDHVSKTRSRITAFSISAFSISARHS